MSYILVCVKQVPDTSEVRLDSETNSLIRSGVTNIVNPYDTYALEAAARIRDGNPDIKIAALSMGPAQAEDALKNCVAIAADSAYLVSDPAFAGSDTYATSYILSCAVRRIEKTEGQCLAIFCGKQAIDGDTAQIGPALAERLGIPQVTSVLEAELVDGGFNVLQEDKAAKRRLFIQQKCLLTFTKPAFEPRQATLKRRMAAGRCSIEKFDKSLLPEIKTDRVGIKGSPTSVVKVFTPAYRGKCEIISGKPDVSAKSLLDRLRERSLIDGGKNEIH